MVDFEKGSPAWDIGMILTRHNTAQAGGQPCAMVEELWRTAGMRMSGTQRLAQARMYDCNCGAGESSAETTSIKEIQHEPETDSDPDE